MNQAIQIIQNDLRAYSGYGHSCQTYDSYHVVVALEDAGIDPDSLPVSPTGLLIAAYENLLETALGQ